MRHSLDIPSSWQRLDEKLLTGVVIVIGSTDAGKSTFVRYLAEKVRNQRIVAVIDGDIGQTAMGPPATQTLRCYLPNSDSDSDYAARWFVGGTSAASNREHILIGLERLVRKAEKCGVQTIFADTTGFISPDAGAHTLKWSKFDLLRPSTVIALKKGDELEPILSPWRKSGRFSLIELPVSQKVQKATAAKRKAIRRENFHRYFRDAHPVSISMEKVGVVGRWPLMEKQLVGLIDTEGFLLSLGIVKDLTHDDIVVVTPDFNPQKLDMLRTGTLLLDEKMNEKSIF